MPDYRRDRVPGAPHFFTVNLPDREHPAWPPLWSFSVSLEPERTSVSPTSRASLL
jgi:hypothetical protein